MLKNMFCELILKSFVYQKACSEQERRVLKHYEIPGVGDSNDESEEKKLDRKTALKEYKFLCDQLLVELNSLKNPDSFKFSTLKPHLEFLAEIFQKHEDNPEASEHYYDLANACDFQLKNPQQIFKPFPHWDQLKGKIHFEKKEKENSKAHVLKDKQINPEKGKTVLQQIELAAKIGDPYKVSIFAIPLKTLDFSKKFKIENPDLRSPSVKSRGPSH